MTEDLLKKSLNNQSSDLSTSDKLDKIIIVIDNIDRCDSETSYELLTNIKSFLSNQEGVILLVPVDDEALKRHLSIGSNTITNTKSISNTDEKHTDENNTDENNTDEENIDEENIDEENTDPIIKEAGEFLRKFFNVVLTIKYFKNIDLFKYADKN